MPSAAITATETPTPAPIATLFDEVELCCVGADVDLEVDVTVEPEEVIAELEEELEVVVAGGYETCAVAASVATTVASANEKWLEAVLQHAKLPIPCAPVSQQLRNS